MENHQKGRLSVADVAKRIYSFSAKHNFPMTEKNYSIWYEYFMDGNQELVAELDEILSSERPFTGDLSDYLYSKYCENGIDRSSKEALYGAQEILKSIIEEIPKTNNATSDYGASLEAYSTELDKADHLSQVLKLVKGLISDTNKMAETTSNLQTKLNDATKRAEKLKQQLVKAEGDALIDALTGLHNRKGLTLEMKELYDEYMKNGTGFSIIMLDIDFFKKFNDTYGHQVGEQVLKIVGSTLHKSLKGGDFPARYGGEEFIVILPETKISNACIVAENIRKNIESGKRKIAKTGEKLKPITVSLGVSQMNASDTVESLIERADKALYLAKDSGRNNVKSESAVPAPRFEG